MRSFRKKLSLYTDSAVWSSQLRFYHQTILQTVSDYNHGYFETVQFKIIPQANEIEKKKKKKFPSIENIDFIINLAEKQDDKNLKNALNKLGNTLKIKFYRFIFLSAYIFSEKLIVEFLLCFRRLELLNYLT